MPKAFFLFFASLLTIGTAVHAQEQMTDAEIAPIVAAASGASTCVLAAGKNGVDRSRFDASEEWLSNESGGYQSANSDVVVTFPKDDDGVARICEVTATLGSQDHQSQLINSLTVLLRQKPIEQSNSLIWMYGQQDNARGLQLFFDRQSEKPQIRLIGAAF